MEAGKVQPPFITARRYFSGRFDDRTKIEIGPSKEERPIAEDSQRKPLSGKFQFCFDNEPPLIAKRFSPNFLENFWRPC